MADPVRIRITSGVVGDDGTDWLRGMEVDATPAFARVLFARGCAVPAAPDAGASSESTTRDITPRKRR